MKIKSILLGYMIELSGPHFFLWNNSPQHRSLSLGHLIVEASRSHTDTHTC